MMEGVEKNLVKLQDDKHYEKMMKSILLQSQETPDMKFIAKDGQVVACNRFLIGLFCPDLTTLIKSTPDWEDTVIHLPNSSQETVRHILSLLYSITAVDAPENIDEDEMEFTAKLFGVQLPVFKNSNNSPDLVDTLNESIIEEENTDEIVYNVDVNCEITKTVSDPLTNMNEDLITDSQADLQLLQEDQGQDCLNTTTEFDIIDDNEPSTDEIVPSEEFGDHNESFVSEILAMVKETANLVDSNDSFVSEIIALVKENAREDMSKDSSETSGKQADQIADNVVATEERPRLSLVNLSELIAAPANYGNEITDISPDDVNISNDDSVIVVEPEDKDIPFTFNQTQDKSNIEEDISCPEVNNPSETDIEDDEDMIVIATYLEPRDVTDNLSEDIKFNLAAANNAEVLESSNTAEKENTRKEILPKKRKFGDENCNPSSCEEVKKRSRGELNVAPQLDTTADGDVGSIQRENLGNCKFASSLKITVVHATEKTNLTKDIENDKDTNLTENADSPEDGNNSEVTNPVSNEYVNSTDEVVENHNVPNLSEIEITNVQHVPESIDDVAISILTEIIHSIVENHEAQTYSTVKVEPVEFFLNTSEDSTESTESALTNPLEVNPLSPSGDNSTRPAFKTNSSAYNTRSRSLSLAKPPHESNSLTLVKSEHKTPTKNPEASTKIIPKTPTFPTNKNVHCDMCMESFSLKIELAKHYCSGHFEEELEKLIPDFFADENICIQCEVKTSDSKKEKLEHIGQKHKKVFYVMREKGMDIMELFRENRVRKFKPVKENSKKFSANNPEKLKTNPDLTVEAQNTLNLDYFPAVCKLCSLRFTSTTQLTKHYSSAHFYKELKAKIENCFQKSICKLCGSTIFNEKEKVFHLGLRHEEVKELLASAGVKVDNTPQKKENQTIKSLGTSSASKISKFGRKRKMRRSLRESKNPSEPASSSAAHPVSKKIKVNHNRKSASINQHSADIEEKSNEKKDPLNEEESTINAIENSLNSYLTGKEKVVTSKANRTLDNDDSYWRVRRRAANADEPRNFVCSVCPKRYTNNNHLNDHYSGFHYKDDLNKKYGDGTSLTCIFCGKTSLNRVKYAMHVGAVHQKLTDFGIEFSKKEGRARFRKSI